MQADGSLTLLERVLALPSVAFAERGRRLPDRPGLYFAIRDGEEVLYIGMATKSIRQRWKTWHLAATNATKERIENRVRIAFVVYSDTSSLKEDERAALREFRPLWNTAGVPGALERQQQRVAESCEWIDCDEHWHSKWPPLKPPTKNRPCVCIVHITCGERQGAAYRHALDMPHPDPAAQP